MPFACEVVGGRVQVQPGPSRSYRVFQPLERRAVTTCPGYPGQDCRRATLYRFDMDCGGVRVDWLSVVAALTAWAEERSAGWRGPHPARRPGPYPGPYHARPRPNQLATLPPMVALPSGFAAMPAELAFLQDVPGAPPDAPLASIPAPRRDLVADARETASDAPPLPLPKPKTIRPVEPGATPTAQAERAAEAVAPPSSAVAAPSGDELLTGTIPAPSMPYAASAWRIMLATAALGLLALVASGIVFALSLRRPAIVAVAAPLRREPVLGGEDRYASSGATASGELPAPPATTQSRQLSTTAAEWLPTTLAEALAVLGVPADSRAGAIKAVVKRLRRKWHPDHAVDEVDRRLRERRLKQINVAWDIIRGRRGAAGPGVSSQTC